MIAVLQRQHVHRRAANPIRVKAHPLKDMHGFSQRGPRWENSAAIPARFVPTRLSAPAVRRARVHGAHVPLALLVRSPRVIAAAVVVILAALLGILLFVPGLREAALPLERPLLPSPPETDQDVYRMLVPEEQPATGAGSNPVLSSTLKVADYRTQAGESISQIAQRFRLNLDTVISWNDIRDARSIHPGTVLSIPNSDGLKYTVRRGDTLEQIAKANGLPLNAVLDWNRLPSSTISVGQALFLPGVHMRTNDLNSVLGNLFIYPVRGKISSFFGSRPDPFTGVRRFHNGVDIVNAPGTPIMAAMEGTVEDVGFNNNYGYYVILRHSGYQTLYGHLSRYLVERREKVQQGEKIGELGTTGYSTGPHLHFSIFRNGEAVDPLPFLK
ncbi:MAG: M23 family metallopeptidase [Spirochaetia bacterium]|jgi:murein DD-endopeptidase MepM/ murein hydrolase activator NlpD